MWGRIVLNPVCQGCTNAVYLVTRAAGSCIVLPNAFCIIIIVSLSLPTSPNLQVCKYMCVMYVSPHTPSRSTRWHQGPRITSEFCVLSMELLHGITVGSRIWRRLLYFWKICGPLLCVFNFLYLPKIPFAQLR